MKRTEQCQRCKATLSGDLNYCPKCNWKKSRHVVPDTIEETTDVEELTDVKDKPKKDKPKKDKQKKDKSKKDEPKIIAKTIKKIPKISGKMYTIFALV